MRNLTSLLTVIFAAFHLRPYLLPCTVGQQTDGSLEYGNFGWLASSPSVPAHIATHSSENCVAVQSSNGIPKEDLIWEPVDPELKHDGFQLKLDRLQLKPDDPQLKPDSSQLKPDDPQVKPDGPQLTLASRPKRETTPKVLRRNSTLFGLLKKEVLTADRSLEALLRNIIVNHMEGCEMIIVYDKPYLGSRALEAVAGFPVIKQVLQLVELQDLTDKIEWLSKECRSTIILLSEPNLLLSFGTIDRFHWAYRAKVIIVGWKLPALEAFLKTKKGKKTENIIGVVKEDIDYRYKIYMNLLFWGEGMKQITEWSGQKFTRKAELFPDKITDLRGGVVTVVLYEWRPILFFERYENGTIIKRHGRDLTLVETLSEQFNYTLVYADIPLEPGYPLPNGTWTGIVGHLHRDLAQMGLAHLYASGLDDRHKFQDYSRPMEDDKGCFLIRIEAPLPPWQAPILPFQLQTWIAFLTGLVISGPIFYGLVMASSNFYDEYEEFKSLSYSSLFTVGIHFDAPLVVLPKAMSSQIFIVFLLVYNLILSTGYRSNLISFLTVARPPKQIETVKDLYESGLPVRTFPWWATALNYTGNPDMKKLLQRYEVRYTSEEIIPEVVTGETSVVSSRANLEVISSLLRTKSGKPVLRFIKECVMSYSVGITFQWHTPLKRKFNRAIAGLTEGGFPKLWLQQSKEHYRKLAEKDGLVSYYDDIWHDIKDGLIPLSIDHTMGVFIIITFGYFFACIAFAVEVFT